jgi:hypothetical protein
MADMPDLMAALEASLAAARTAKAERQTAARLAAEERATDVATGTTIEDLIRESVGEMSWAEVDWELRTRHPAEWEPPADDADKRALLVRTYIEERERKIRNGDGHG